MFYDKKIDILSFSDGYSDDYGLWHNGGETVLKTIQCDVQPITKELANKIFGYEDTVEYRVFCDIDANVDTGTIIQYKNKKYKVVKIFEWDDYLDLLVDGVRT
ncbi:hypothetical protein [Acetivibrio cellulolyticus]|uniref:hypothetical protein n=1 Tax=Acetivibrio cellulolyticus TaxID=35830 RepID=UPI0001E2C296|nr:hypothetical protein [Acetivibrio cellulolyticus]